MSRARPRVDSGLLSNWEAYEPRCNASEPYNISDEAGATRRKGTPVTAAPHWINASDFASIQDAVDRLSATGGTVYIPKGTYDKNSVPAYEGGLLLPNQSKPVHLVGDGPGLTILKANSTDTVADMLQVYCPYATVTGLTLDGTNQPAGGRGLVLVPSVNPSTQLVIPGVAIADCHIMGTASWGIYVRGVVAGSTTQ